jgi:hypothetical protein
LDNRGVPPRRVYEYRVERDLWGPIRADISLIRRSVRRRLRDRLRRREPSGDVVLFHQTFTPRLELDDLERYAAELERAAGHGNDGTLGCFVDTRTRDSVVKVALYERWFDGSHLRCDELACRSFDPDDDGALVASAEFVAELEDWAEQRNDAREASYLEASVEDAARDERALEHASAANELAQILARHSARAE